MPKMAEINTLYIHVLYVNLAVNFFYFHPDVCVTQDTFQGCLIEVLLKYIDPFSWASLANTGLTL